MLSTSDIEQSNNNTSEITPERAEKSAVCGHSDSQSCDLSKHVVVANTTQSNVSTCHEKILTNSTVTLSAKQQSVSNETSKAVSVQKTSSVSAVRQQIHTTTQKTVSVSSMQSAQSVMVDKVQTSITDVTKTENMMADRKDSKNQKTKSSNKSEDKNEEEMHSEKIHTEENVKSSKSEKKDKNGKSKSPQCDNKKKTDHSPTKNQEKVSKEPMQTEKDATSTNGKASKPNQKLKKNNKQERQVETKSPIESEKQSVSQDVKVDVKEATEVKVISEPKEVKTELKQGIKKVTSSPAAESTPAVTVSMTDSQPETPAPAKKKKKSKKSKGGAQPGQGKKMSTESQTCVTETKTATSEKSHQTQETIAVSQIHKSIKEEQIQVKREIITTESKDDQNTQQQKAVQKQVKGSQKKKGVTVIKQSAEEPSGESKNVPITVTGESEHNERVKSTAERTEESQRQEVQVLISHITDIQRVSENTDSKSVLKTIPDWLLSPESKCEMEGSVVESDAQKSEEILSGVRKLAEAKLMHLEDNETMEKHECEPVSEKSVSGGATPRISKISIGSAKIENQTKTSHERRKEEVSLSKSVDLRAPSPLLRMRSPSPTFITIESTRRTDSPQRVTPSPTLLHRPPTPPTPPPRRCDTPISRLTRITPSPTFDRAENLARLKDTTAKLSRGVTPPPLLPQQISERKSEIVESPASFHRRIKIESQHVEASGTSIATEKPKNLYANEIQNSIECHMPKFFEEAQKAEINKTYTKRETVPAEPSAFSETKSITEHFSNVDEFGNKVTGTRTAVTAHSESVSTQRAPFSYADAVKKQAAAMKQTETYDDDATDKLLSNFHKTWTESESVFKSLGYTISEETTSQVVSHQTNIVSSGKYLMSEESLSDGCSDSGQKKVP
uniref:Xin actin binding repeat containing 2 n=1 Tax=Sander lucioperca TaxID=283035 RepID=A0A8D0CZ61_SANLU